MPRPTSFEAIYKERCGKDSLGYEAWKRLIVMSNLQKNAERSRELAEAEKKNSCAKTDLQMAEEKRGDLTDIVLQNAAFEDANKVFEQAKAAPPGPQKDALWRKAAAMYAAALDAAPAHKDAPAAAINSAFCYKQVGEFDKAIKLYQMFIDNYGSEDILNRLQNGGIDPEKQAKVGPDPAEYKERIKYLGMAYDALSTTYYGFFAYQHAAESFGKIASNPRFDDPERANAARIAMVLYSNLGDRANMSRMYAVSSTRGCICRTTSGPRPTTSGRASTTPSGTRRPGSRRGNCGVARPGDREPRAVPRREQGPARSRRATRSSRRIAIAKMMQSAGDPAFRTWFKTTIADWEYFKSYPLAVAGAGGKAGGRITSTDAPYSDYGGEADFTLVDEQVKSEFDYATGHHHYAGNVVDVTKALDKDLGEAEKKWRPLLEHVATEYGSFEWAAAATARDRDALRLDPHGTRPRRRRTTSRRSRTRCSRSSRTVADKLNDAGQGDKADQVQKSIDDTKDAVRAKWRATKDQYLEVCNQKMVGKYVTAALIARKYNVKDAAVQNARRAAGVFHRLPRRRQDEAVRREHPRPLDPDSKLVYANGEFLQWRSGVVSTPPASGQPAPLPAAP